MEPNIQLIAAIDDLIDHGDQGDTWDDLRLLALAIKAMAEGSE